MEGIIAAYMASLLYGLAIAVYGPATRRNSVFAMNALFSLFGLASGFTLAQLRGETLSGAVAYAALASVLGGYVGGTLYLLSIRTSGPTVASTVANTYILFTPLVHCAFFGGTCIGVQDYLAIGAVFSGLSLLSWDGGRRTLVGPLLALGAAVAWSFSANLLELGAKGLGAGYTLMVRSAVLGPLSLVTWVAAGRRPLVDVRRVALGGLLDNGVSLYLYILAMELADVVTATLLISLYPIHTLAFSMAINKERLPARKYIGVALSIIGTAMYIYF